MTWGNSPAVFCCHEIKMKGERLAPWKTAWASVGKGRSHGLLMDACVTGRTEGSIPHHPQLTHGPHTWAEKSWLRWSKQNLLIVGKRTSHDSITNASPLTQNSVVFLLMRYTSPCQAVVPYCSKCIYTQTHIYSSCASKLDRNGLWNLVTKI